MKSFLGNLTALVVLILASWALVGGTLLIVWRVFLRPFGAMIGAFEFGE